MYLGWYDDSAKHTLETKIADAAAAYARKFGAAPNVALVAAAEVAPARVAGCAVRSATYIRPNTVWVGIEAQP